MKNGGNREIHHISPQRIFTQPQNRPLRYTNCSWKLSQHQTGGVGSPTKDFFWTLYPTFGLIPYWIYFYEHVHRSPVSSVSPPSRTFLSPAWRSGPTAPAPCLLACRCWGRRCSGAWSWCLGRSSFLLPTVPWSCSSQFELMTGSSGNQLL